MDKKTIVNGNFLRFMRIMYSSVVTLCNKMVWTMVIQYTRYNILDRLKVEYMCDIFLTHGIPTQFLWVFGATIELSSNFPPVKRPVWDMSKKMGFLITSSYFSKNLGGSMAYAKCLLTKATWSFWSMSWMNIWQRLTMNLRAMVIFQ